MALYDRAMASPMTSGTRRAWRPQWLDELSRETWRADALAGLLGAVLVLPQAIAFATLAGLAPQYGLYTALVPCVIAALFGSSRYVMSGPTNALSLALFAMLSPLAAPGSPAYIELALTVTVLVGLLQLAIGLLRLGSLAHFISPAALLGFTGGAAALIALHALEDVLGVAAPGTERGSSAVLRHLAAGLGLLPHQPASWQEGSVVVGLFTLGVALAARRWKRRWPHALIGLAAGTLLAAALNRLGGPWHTAVVGAIPSAWPAFHVPQVDWTRLPELLGLAFALTIVALGQSISIAKVLASRAGDRLDANREFVGQGLSNAVGGFFSSYVSCGSLNRSLPNYEAGARTPMASVLSAVWLLALVMLSAQWLAAIPMAAVAGLLLLVAWNLLDLPRWRQTWKLDRVEFAIALATLVATVTLRLEVAILAGTILSLLAYLHRTSHPAMRTMGFDTMDEERHFVVVDAAPRALPECPQLKLLRMEGAVYFGAAQHVADRLDALRAAPHAPKHLLVMAKSMNFIDLAGAQVWEDELRLRRAMGGDLYFHRPRPPVLEFWERSGFLDRLGRDHVFPDKRRALATIFGRLDPRICAACRARVFWECRTAPLDLSPDEQGLGATAAAAAPPAAQAGTALDFDTMGGTTVALKPVGEADGPSPQRTQGVANEPGV